jgi:putative DNA primase/helicase
VRPRTQLLSGGSAHSLSTSEHPERKTTYAACWDYTSPDTLPGVRTYTSEKLPCGNMNQEHHPEHAARYAEALRERIEQKGILRELAGYPNFVVWRYQLVEGKRKKPPFNPNTHQPASPTDSTTWGTLACAFHALVTGQYQGIGFMLSRSPFTGIDLDHCIEKGKLLPWAQEIIRVLDTYTEYSPSWNRATGTGGVHLLVAGKPPASKKVGNVELYGEKHYLTITTNHLPGTPTTINSRQEALDALYRYIAPPGEKKPFQNTRGGVRGEPLTGLPEEAERDELLQRLLRGDSTGYTSQSSADFVLVLKLLHWTDDNIELTRQLFLESGLYREKTGRKTGSTTYLDMTIHNALKKRRNPPMRR